MSGHDTRIYIDPAEHPLLETLKVGVPIAAMRGAADVTRPQTHELLYGQSFNVHRDEGKWVWGQENSPSGQSGYVGYVKKSDLAYRNHEVTHMVTALRAPLFSAADIKSPCLVSLSRNALLAGQMEGAFLKTAAGYVHARHIRELDEGPVNRDFVSIAESYMGLPYVWGGVSATGLDCSGIVQAALRATGQDAPRDSDMQAKLGTPVKINDDLSGLMRGDLVFWKGHVGIMLDAARLLHANAHHMCVFTEDLEQAARRIKNAEYGEITKIRRL